MGVNKKDGGRGDIRRQEKKPTRRGRTRVVRRDPGGTPIEIFKKYRNGGVAQSQISFKGKRASSGPKGKDEGRPAHRSLKKLRARSFLRLKRNISRLKEGKP